MTDFRALLRALSMNGVEFVIVGGAAAIAHGSARLTQDLDIVYRRGRANHQRLIDALGGLHPYLRGAPPGLPFRWDLETLGHGLNFTLVTDQGDIDLLGEIVGGGAYEQLAPKSVRIELFDVECLCLDLEPLIRAKRAAGRPKDLEVIAELEKLLEIRRRTR